MNISSWNVRGFNSSPKIVVVKKLLAFNKGSCFALIETKVKDVNKVKIRKKLGNKWKWEDNYSCSPRERLWFA